MTDYFTEKNILEDIIDIFKRDVTKRKKLQEYFDN